MSHPQTPDNWKPKASLNVIEARSQLYAQIREFFSSRNILEVDTPILNKFAVSDVNIDSLSVAVGETKKFLHTSPEYAMKRMLANFKQDIYQLCKVFRANEEGKHHHTEFTMLEWYRLDWDHEQLMQEVDALIKIVSADILSTKKSEYISYQALFKKFCNLDPLTAKLSDYKELCRVAEISINGELALTEYQDLILDQFIAPKLAVDNLTFIHDFPKEQAALAKINDKGFAQRFEVYLGKIELANGFHELTDAKEQLDRFGQDNKKRQEKVKVNIEIDELFLNSLRAGLPACAGVALGIDRLLMLLMGVEDIKDVLEFPNG